MSNSNESERKRFSPKDLAIFPLTAALILEMKYAGMLRRPWPIQTRIIFSMPYLLYLGVGNSKERQFQRERCEEAYRLKMGVDEFRDLENEMLDGYWDPVHRYLTRKNLEKECAVLSEWRKMRRSKEAEATARE